MGTLARPTSRPRRLLEGAIRTRNADLTENGREGLLSRLRPAIALIRTSAATALIGISLCLVIYQQAWTISNRNEDAVQAFVHGWQQEEFPTYRNRFGVFDLQKAWGGRVLSLACAGLFTRPADAPGGSAADVYRRGVGLYVALWLGLVFALYMACLRREALLAILATFAGVSFGYLPGMADRVLPWDMPALFFFALFVCLTLRGKSVWFLPLLPVAILFKESTAVIAVAYVFLAGATRRRRLILFGTAVALSVSTRVVLGVAQNADHGPLLTGILWSNLEFFFLGRLEIRSWFPGITAFYHPVFVNAGLVAAFFLVPFESPHARMLRVLAVVFIGSLFVFGNIVEYRIWFELIPICICPFLMRHATGAAGPGTG